MLVILVTLHNARLSICGGGERGNLQFFMGQKFPKFHTGPSYNDSAQPTSQIRNRLVLGSLNNIFRGQKPTPTIYKTGQTNYMEDYETLAPTLYGCKLRQQRVRN